MANQKRPTASQLRYLLVMREADTDGAVHSVDVARILGVKKPSVYSVMNAFSEAGWIRKGRYGAAVFTEEGRKLSDRYAAACRTIETILSAHFPSLTDIGAVACTLLSALSDEGIDALAKGQIPTPGEQSDAPTKGQAPTPGEQSDAPAKGQVPVHGELSDAPAKGQVPAHGELSDAPAKGQVPAQGEQKTSEALSGAPEEPDIQSEQKINRKRDRVWQL